MLLYTCQERDSQHEIIEISAQIFYIFFFIPYHKDIFYFIFSQLLLFFPILIYSLCLVCDLQSYSVFFNLTSSTSCVHLIIIASVFGKKGIAVILGTLMRKDMWQQSDVEPRDTFVYMYAINIVTGGRSNIMNGLFGLHTFGEQYTL